MFFCFLSYFQSFTKPGCFFVYTVVLFQIYRGMFFLRIKILIIRVCENVSKIYLKQNSFDNPKMSNFAVSKIRGNELPGNFIKLIIR